jgi:hypothetical protein
MFVFCPFSSCLVCPSIYNFLITIWDLQTFLGDKMGKHEDRLTFGQSILMFAKGQSILMFIKGQSILMFAKGQSILIFAKGQSPHVCQRSVYLNMTAVTHGTGTVYSSGATDFTPGFYKAPISGCVDQCLSFVLFLLVLSVLQFTTPEEYTVPSP